MTDMLQVDALHPDPQTIARAAAVLRRGGLVAFPTETVYGLGVHALDAAAVRRLFTAKGRPASDPLIVHVPSLGDVEPLVEQIPPAAAQLAAAFWPGPLTLVMRRSSRVPDEITAGLGSVAIRVPAHPVARALLQAAAVPIAAPSANLFSRPSPTRASHVVDDLDGRIDLVIDGGPTTVGVESTVLDLSSPLPAILRPGAITAAMLRRFVPALRDDAPPRVTGGAMLSPGLLDKHYSPRAPLTLYEGEDAVEALVADATAAAATGKTVGLLLATEDELEIAPALRSSDSAPPVRVVTVGSVRDLSQVAARLYAALRELDQLDVDLIFARGFPVDADLSAAIQDRLRRAAAGRVVRR
jgi:L-threonylcarbamoyladenylate synthase